MKKLNTGILLLILAINFNVSAKEDHKHEAHKNNKAETKTLSHDHSHEQSQVQYKKPEKKYNGDENLKNGMKSVLANMKSLLSDKSKDRVKVQKETGAKIQQAVQDMFKNCKLDKDADAAAHIILADILKGADQIAEGKEDEGHHLIHAALVRYEESFEKTGLGMK